MKKLVLLAMLVASPTMAQEVTLKVTAQELGVIGKALGTQPYNDVASLVNKLQTQLIEQQKAAEEKKPTEQGK